MTDHLPEPRGPVPACGRDPLVGAITRFLAVGDTQRRDEIRDSLEREIDAAGPDALEDLGARLAAAGANWSYYPSDPLARRIHHVLAARVLEHEPVLLGTEHLAMVAGHPVVMFANHLSYSDANLLEVLFERAGHAELSDRLTVVAGPKVYSNVTRRFSSLCFGTIKVPQSSGRSSGDAVMDGRTVARAARRSIEIAHDRLRLGEALLVFPEGSRSRTGGMQPMLPGVARYLDGPAAWVLPVGISGTEGLFPIGGDTLHPVRIVTRVGRPIRACLLREGARGRRGLMMDALGLAIAALLPPQYRGAYAERAELPEARRLFSDINE